MPKPKEPEAPTQTSLSGCLVRLCWMLFGNAVLLILAVFISQHTGAFLSPADAAFWATVLALVAVRYWDIAKLKGFTVTSEPATLSHWRRYVVLLIVASLVLWLAAHGVARLS